MHWDQFSCFIYQLFLRLHDLESAGIVHCNLTPDHIGHNRATGEVSLHRLGRARTVEQLKQTKEVLQTGRYCAPESLQNKPRTSAIDIWSIGCILAEMILGKLH